MRKLILLNSILFLTWIQIFATNNIPSTSRYGYIENKGQIIDQNNNLNPEVKYLFNGYGLNIQLKSNGFSYDSYFIERIPKKTKEDEKLIHDKFKTLDEDIIYHFHRIDIEFIGANKNPKVISEIPLSDYTNYYTIGTNEEGVTNVRTYQIVTYKNLYNGIDLQFTLDENNHPKYNFIVHEGADASKIKWKYNGALNTGLTDGKITLTVESGKLEEKIPASFTEENNQNVTVNYISFYENTFGFSIGDYNKNSTLIIDPIPWATYYGGIGTDENNAISMDASGNILITGTTTSALGIATAGAYQTTLAAVGNDAFIAKFNASGSRIWATYYGGVGSEIGYGISSDASGNILITGSTNSSASGIATAGAYQTVNSGSNDAFIAKFNASGSRIWATYFGGSGGEISHGISTDTSGNILITGITSSTTGIATTGAYQTVKSGGSNDDAFIAKFNASGTRIWATYFGGSGIDRSYGISSDASGNISIIGRTSSTTGIATAGAYQTVYSGGNFDAFTAKFNASGSRIWATYFGGSGIEYGYAISMDASGNILITGSTSSATGIATTGAYQTVFGGNLNAFIAKFNASGSRIWATYYGGIASPGGSGYDNSNGISSDASGNILITGSTTSATGIATTGAYQTVFGGDMDGFTAKFNASGSLIWGTYLGGSDIDFSNGIASDASGNIIIAGNTKSASGIATTGAYQTVYGVGSLQYDGFIAAFTSVGVLPVKLTQFNATKENTNILIKWQTASELNNNHFNVERSEVTGHWEVIGKVEGNGTTNLVHHYQFRDTWPSLSETNTLYYRLKQVDFDGKFEYSAIVSVTNSEITNNEIRISPNPTIGAFELKSSSVVSLVEIYDMLGLKLFSVSPDDKSINFNLSGFKKGMYFLKCSMGNEIMTRKLMIE